MRKFLLVFALTVAVTGLARAQQAPQAKAADIQFRLAESYEQSGDFESAVRIYESLYGKDSSNMVVFEALRRDYMQLKLYDKAITLLERFIRKMPDNISLLSELASVHMLKSDEPKADAIWERAIGVDPKHEITYRLVGSSMLQSRQFERAINVYKRGRIACGDPALFTPDIAYLYSITLKYPEATLEYIDMVRQNPAQLGFVESRIATYTGRTDGLNAATVTVEKAVKAEPANLSCQQMLAWLYMEGKHYDQAFEVYKLIDDKSHAEGHELFNFATRALNEKAYAVSAKAFTGIVEKFPKFDQMALVKFGYAHTQEELQAETDTLNLFGGVDPFAAKPAHAAEGTPLYGGAIAAYEQVIGEFPTTEIAARSMLRIAILKQERLFDLAGARAELEKLSGRYAMFPGVIEEATLRLGDVYLTLGDLEKAEAEYRILAGHGLIVNPRQETAALRLAELDYFRINFQSALSKLKDLTRNAGSDVTNDALSLQIFIQDNIKQDSLSLKEFAQADLLKRRQKIPEALAAFEAIVKAYPKSNAVDEALMSTGDLLTRLERYTDALAVYNRLLKEFPESIVLDRTVMKIAEVYRLGLKDPANAIATYQKLLEQYPNSIYAGQARARIRELRGDNI
jgi:tetratricopeptide (TPR) repeat protein